MFAHLRCFFSALAISTGVFTSLAYSNPLADRSNSKVATERAAAPAAPQETCFSSPGKSATAGQRWVYHRVGDRKCWFQTAEQPQLKRRVRYRPAKASIVAAAENGSMLPKPKRVEDAQAELLPVRTERPQALQSASGLEVVAAAPVLSTGRASLLTGELDRLESDNRTGRRLDTDTSQTRAPPQSVASHAPLVAAAASGHLDSGALDDKPGWPSTWIAVLLMTLGFSSILGSNRTVRDIVMFRSKGAQVRPC